MAGIFRLSSSTNTSIPPIGVDGLVPQSDAIYVSPSRESNCSPIGSLSKETPSTASSPPPHMLGLFSPSERSDEFLRLLSPRYSCNDTSTDEEDTSASFNYDLTSEHEEFLLGMGGMELEAAPVKNTHVMNANHQKVKHQSVTSLPSVPTMQSKYSIRHTAMSYRMPPQNFAPPPTKYASNPNLPHDNSHLMQNATDSSNLNNGGQHPFGEHPSRTLFVRNINSNVEDDELRQLFEHYGPIRSMYTQCKHRGFVMISYFDIRHAKNAMRHLQTKVLRRRKLDIHYSIPKDNPSEKDVNQGTLVVFNLDPSITNDQLLSIFGAFGEIKEIRETPNKKHHKFIEFYDVRDADRAMKHLNKTEIKSKKIKIEPSRPGGARKGNNHNITNDVNYGMHNADQELYMRHNYTRMQPKNGNYGISQYHDGNSHESHHNTGHSFHRHRSRSTRQPHTQSHSQQSPPHGNPNYMPRSRPYRPRTKSAARSAPTNLMNDISTTTWSSQTSQYSPRSALQQSAEFFQPQNLSPQAEVRNSPPSNYQDTIMLRDEYSPQRRQSFEQATEVEANLASSPTFTKEAKKLEAMQHGSVDNDDESSKYTLRIHRIRNCEETRTTLMIKNIPNKYTQKMLLAAVDDDHKGQYDFFYLPIDFKNKCNVGYAFINFISVNSIISFYYKFHNKKWEKFNSEKVCDIAFARIQNKAALIAHFQNSSLMCEDKKCRPIIFHSTGPNQGQQEPFPVGPNVRLRRESGGSKENKAVRNKNKNL